jgi:hypothetical protein
MALPVVRAAPPPGMPPPTRVAVPRPRRMPALVEVPRASKKVMFPMAIMLPATGNRQ